MVLKNSDMFINSIVSELKTPNEYNDNFEQMNNLDELLSMVMFYAPWCPHCHTAKPVLENFARSSKGIVKVNAVNCEERPELGKKCKVISYPTIYFSDGKKKYKYENERTVENLMDTAKNILNMSPTKSFSEVPKVPKVPKKPLKKVTKKPLKKVIKKITKKPLKKVIKKVTKKITKKPLKKVIKKVTKKITKKPLKKVTKKITKKLTPNTINTNLKNNLLNMKVRFGSSSRSIGNIRFGKLSNKFGSVYRPGSMLPGMNHNYVLVYNNKPLTGPKSGPKSGSCFGSSIRTNAYSKYFGATSNKYLSNVAFGKKSVSFGSMSQVSDFVSRYLIKAPKEFTRNMLDNAKDFFNKHMGNQANYRKTRTTSMYNYDDNISPKNLSDKLQNFKYNGYPYASNARMSFDR